MIVVVGDPVLALSVGGAAGASGQAVAIARACVRSGATVQLAGKLGDDPAGDEALLALTRDGIGHVALLRDAGVVTAIVDAPPVPGEDDGVDAELPLAGATEEDVRPATAEADATRTVSSLGPEDLDLALRYLTSFGVLIVGQPVTAATLAVAVENAAYAGAHLILIDVADGIPPVPSDDLTVLGAPAEDPEGDFAGLVGRYAAALDAGRPASTAFRTALGAAGSESTLV